MAILRGCVSRVCALSISTAARPLASKRALRQMVSLLSLLSAGLGLVWALVDEENLTWHDHISKTFPTPG
jgi:hypothetical protein